MPGAPREVLCPPRPRRPVERGHDSEIQPPPNVKRVPHRSDTGYSRPPAMHRTLLTRGLALISSIVLACSTTIALADESPSSVTGRSIRRLAVRCSERASRSRSMVGWSIARPPAGSASTPSASAPSNLAMRPSISARRVWRCLGQTSPPRSITRAGLTLATRSMHPAYRPVRTRSRSVPTLPRGGSTARLR